MHWLYKSQVSGVSEGRSVLPGSMQREYDQILTEGHAQQRLLHPMLPVAFNAASSSAMVAPQAELTWMQLHHCSGQWQSIQQLCPTCKSNSSTCVTRGTSPRSVHAMCASASHMPWQCRRPNFEHTVTACMQCTASWQDACQQRHGACHA
jgi:hypothetical protein